ncbi:MAG: NfeD family protein [Ktedonobacterales bacterium]
MKRSDPRQRRKPVNTEKAWKRSVFGLLGALVAGFALLAGLVAIVVHGLFASQGAVGSHAAVAGATAAVALNPNLLFLLFLVAAVCLYLELAHPGALVPGVIGAVALVVFLFGAAALSPTWPGLLLMLLAILLLAVDVRLPTHGALTLAGLASLVAGSFVFFSTGATGLLISPFLLLAVAAGMGLVALLVLRFALRYQHSGSGSGGDGLIGKTGVVLEPLAPLGRVRVLGEIWSAELDEINKGIGVRSEVESSVRVVAREGLKLIVEPLSYD